MWHLHDGKDSYNKMPLFEPNGLKLKNNNYFYLSNTVNLESCYLKLFPTWSKKEYFKIIFYLMFLYIIGMHRDFVYPSQIIAHINVVFVSVQSMDNIKCIQFIASLALQQQYLSNNMLKIFFTLPMPLLFLNKINIFWGQALRK